MVLSPEALLPLVATFLERQSWFVDAIADQPESELALAAFDVLETGPPGLGRFIITRGQQNFQLIVGWSDQTDLSRSLRRREAALVGSIASGSDQLVLYDALADDLICLKLLAMATDGTQSAERVRSVSSLTSHAALVFDDRLFMKFYRVLESGERTEVVTTIRLDNVGFNALPGPVGRLRAHGFDLAFVREFLPTALEGRALVLTSLRDLLAYADTDESLPPGARGIGSRVDRNDPDRAAASAGGDLASETFRLGQTIAYLHLALREVFGDSSIDLSPLIDALGRDPRGERSSHNEPSEPAPSSPQLSETVAWAKESDLGHAIRLHGELHLRRVMRSETGWIVAGFSDDPLYRRGGRASSLAPRVGSPIEDLADMFFSFELTAKEALSQRSTPNSLQAGLLAAAWVRRNQASFLRGYLGTPGANALLPAEQITTDALLAGYRIMRRRTYEATFAEVSL